MYVCTDEYFKEWLSLESTKNFIGILLAEAPSSSSSLQSNNESEMSSLRHVQQQQPPRSPGRKEIVVSSNIKKSPKVIFKFNVCLVNEFV